MMNEKKPRANELTDEEMLQVQGGASKSRKVGDKYYAFSGNGDRDRLYLCPRCSRPVHYGTWGRFYCDPCDEGWFDEIDLKLNFGSGLWKEISYLEYYVLQKSSR